MRLSDGDRTRYVCDSLADTAAGITDEQIRPLTTQWWNKRPLSKKKGSRMSFVRIIRASGLPFSTFRKRCAKFTESSLNEWRSTCKLLADVTWCQLKMNFLTNLNSFESMRRPSVKRLTNLRNQVDTMRFERSDTFSSFKSNYNFLFLKSDQNRLSPSYARVTF